VTIRPADADLLAQLYRPVDPSAVVSSGHAFVSTATNAQPPAARALDKCIARTLAAIRDAPLVAVEPHVWKTRGRDLMIRLDGFGPNVAMDEELATAMVLDALDRPRLVGEAKLTLVAALNAIASADRPDARRFACSAPTPWRPACLERSDAEIPATPWWSGTIRAREDIARSPVARTILDPAEAVDLPRVVCVEEGLVTLDDRNGMRLRPIQWSGTAARAMNPMRMLRARADLAATLATMDPHARA